MVGPFWVVEDGRKATVIALAVPLERADTYGDMLTVDNGHLEPLVTGAPWGAFNVRAQWTANCASLVRVPRNGLVVSCSMIPCGASSSAPKHPPCNQAAPGETSDKTTRNGFQSEAEISTLTEEVLYVKCLFSNGPSKDFVGNQLSGLLRGAKHAYIASPYVTMTESVLEAARAGTSISLLAGLNEATNPQALAAVHEHPNVAIRYLTRRFHAKIYISDGVALIGSSNLTDGGLISNREATIRLDQIGDLDRIEELQALFLELWESAQVLTTEKLKIFAAAYAAVKRSGPDPNRLIENAVGKAEPVNINVASATKTPERIFLEELRRQVYEQVPPRVQRGDGSAAGAWFPEA